MLHKNKYWPKSKKSGPGTTFGSLLDVVLEPSNDIFDFFRVFLRFFSHAKKRLNFGRFSFKILLILPPPGDLKIEENQWKSMKNYTNQWKSIEINRIINQSSNNESSFSEQVFPVDSVAIEISGKILQRPLKERIQSSIESDDLGKFKKLSDYSMLLELLR